MTPPPMIIIDSGASWSETASRASMIVSPSGSKPGMLMICAPVATMMPLVAS